MENIKDECNIVTMVDVLNEETEMYEASSAVLGASDDKSCTYLNGYIKRQALYSCLTCKPEAKINPELAIGCCLACSLNCHDSHDLVELYTKRLFRCDCGIKEGSINCQLDSSKKVSSANFSSSSSSSCLEQPNNRNRYNLNFSGLYCICKRPYPDEEDDVQDVMIQCIVCENWYHSRHLSSGKAPSVDSYSEMICGECMKKHEFLQDYVGYSVELVDSEETRNDSTLNVTSLDESTSADDEDQEKRESKKIKLDNETCMRPKIAITGRSDKATFWKDNWRQHLCKCSLCKLIYEKEEVQYLIDEEDTVHFYEEKGKQKPKSNIYDSSLQALSNLPRTNQIDAISSYNRMKEKLFEFLQTFVNNNQIVTDEDIKRFFDTMKEKESNKNQSVQQPYFCR